tara:strand:- start:50 stop:349 length:300 start_codon:yes stop_codon:yes gene_type:complete
MANYDHDAIYKAYPDAATIDDDTGVFKADGSKIDLVQSNIDAARTTLNSEAAAVLYKSQRKAEYPDIGDQLDDLYKKGAFSDDMAAKIKAVKDNYPKPS